MTRRTRSLRAFLLFAAAGISGAAFGTTSGPVRANAGASYPPSCLSAPLVDAPKGPTVTAVGMLPTIALITSELQGTENVQFTFWRVPCEAGRSALLLRISRLSTPFNTGVQMPFGYGLSARQGATVGSVRLATEPNTLSSSLSPGAVIKSSVTVVLENTPTDGAYPGMLVPQALPPSATHADFDFNQAIDVTIPNPTTVSPLPPPIIASVPAYDSSQYPEASLPLAIAGYNVGNYFDPAHNGEGAIVEVGDDAGTPAQRWLNFAWYTFDTAGNPTWIFGTARFVPGTRQVQVPMSYFTNGGFAGAFGASADAHAWGTATVSFPDCATMTLAFAANASLPATIPSGSGTRTWTRLTQENGLACR